MRQYLPISFHPLFSRWPSESNHSRRPDAAAARTHARTTRQWQQQQQKQTKNIAAMKREGDDDDSGWSPPFHFLFALFLLGRHNVSLNPRDDFENVQQLVLLSLYPLSPTAAFPFGSTFINCFLWLVGRFPRNRRATL